MGVDCPGVNSKEIQFEINGDATRRAFDFKNRYLKYKVLGLEDCNLAIDALRPETSKFCDTFLPMYQDFKVAKAVEPEFMKGTSKKELDKRMSDTCYQEEWTKDQIEVIMLAKKTFPDFELPEYLIPLLAGKCKKDIDFDPKHRKPG